MLEVWAPFPTAVEDRADVRELLPTAELREILQRVAELSGRTLVLLGLEGEEICSSDAEFGSGVTSRRGVVVPVTACDRLVAYLRIPGSDVEGSIGRALAENASRCISDRVTIGALRPRSRFLPRPLRGTSGLPWEDPTDDLDRLIRMTRRTLVAEQVLVFMNRGTLVAEGAPIMDLLAGAWPDGGPETPHAIRVGDGPLASVLAGRTPEIVELDGFLAELVGHGQVLAAPLRSKGVAGCLGVLCVSSPMGGVFGEGDLGVVADAAALVANVLDRTARIADNHRRLLDGLQAVLDTADGSLAATRRGHGGRTARYASRVAAEMGVSDARVREIEMAALLHDLGRLGLPVAAQGRADSEHSEWGAAILESVPGYSVIAPMVRHHHDRWDGEGNSTALAGEDLPIGARIIAVCGAFDELTAPASQGAMGLSAGRALERLQAEAGRAYDPTVVHALARAFVL